MDVVHGNDHGQMQPLEPNDPRRIDRYSIVARLGVGGMGTVYLGRSPEGVRVAIKLVHSHLAASEEFRERFVREVQAGRRVPPFCSAQVLDAGLHEQRPFLVSEYISGIPLSRLIVEQGPLNLPSLHALALGTAAGIAAIHGVGLVHRDVKPSNVIVTLGGIRIIDFGIARALDDTSEYTRSGVVMGSLGWAAPEQLNGAPASQAMDIFGWGCLVAFAAIGAHPFGGDDLQSRSSAILNGRPNLSGVPEALRATVAAALEHQPQNRPVAPDILLALIGTVPAPSEQSGIPRPRSRNSKRAAVTLAFALPALAALAVGAAAAADYANGSERPSGTNPTSTITPQSGLQNPDQAGSTPASGTPAPGGAQTQVGRNPQAGALTSPTPPPHQDQPTPAGSTVTMWVSVNPQPPTTTPTIPTVPATTQPQPYPSKSKKKSPKPGE